MLASYKWLCELCPVDATAQDVADRLTELGLEVEGITRCGELPDVVIAEVRKIRPHPAKAKLQLVTVFDGETELEVVCGASNVPAPGGRVLFAREGAVLPGGMTITPRKLAGVQSRGMICSEVELQIGGGEDGIFVVDQALAAEPGTPVERALDLTDWVLDISVTPNRPDCLGHIGLARELSASFGRPLREPKAARVANGVLAAAAPQPGVLPVPLFEAPAPDQKATAVASDQTAAAVALRVRDQERCPRYAAGVVEGVRIMSSPFWLRYRLHVLGLRAINNAVDVTNYALMEFGHPSHVFDLERLRGPALEIRTASVGERILTLDGVEHVVGSDDLLVCDSEGAVAVAGVMGGEQSSVHAETCRVLVECAYFEPRGVRRTARRLGLHTDASHRFERGMDPEAVPRVLTRVCGLLAELSGGRPCTEGMEVYPEPVPPREITLRPARLAALLGESVSRDRCVSLLESLGARVGSASAEALEVRAPSFRPDWVREEDLIEEVARLVGYDALPAEPPRPIASSEGASPLPGFVRKLRSRAAQVGLTEAVNYAFVSPAQLEAARVPTLAVRLANPLSEERSVMRTSLLPGLAANLRRAQRHQVSRTELFELARVFYPSDKPLPGQPYRLAVLLNGPQRAWIGPGAPLDFFDGKGVLAALLSPLLGGAFETRSEPTLAAEKPFLHPRRCANVSMADCVVGVLGELHPEVLDALELEGPVVYAELDVETLFKCSQEQGPVSVTAVPRFPSSSRDLAVEVDEQVQAGQVQAALRASGGSLLESVELFDLYRGQQVGAGKKSLAFRLVYRDPGNTLTDKQVDKAHKRLSQAAQRELGAVLR